MVMYPMKRDMNRFMTLQKTDVFISLLGHVVIPQQGASGGPDHDAGSVATQ